MRFLGLEIARQKRVQPQQVPSRGFWGWIQEPFTGAWQMNKEVKLESVLTFGAVARCIALLSSDVAKMPIRMVRFTQDRIWAEEDNPAYSPVLRQPNKWQNRIQFFTSWMESKLIHGNTYVLKQRDGANRVNAMYVLDPRYVKVLVTEDGGIYYEISRDDLARQHQTSITVPASEIIHDRMNTFYHPLVGISPIASCGIAAAQGLAIQTNGARFFTNNSLPGGMLSAPGKISDETAKRLKDHWDQNYSGANAGKVAVLGDGLKFEPMAMKATDAQLIEQLKMTAETVCMAFGVPAYKAGVGAAPAYNNIEALNMQYYTDALQIHIESIEECLDHGLGISRPLGTEFDLDYLYRMDTATMVEAEAAAVGAGIKKPNESRRRFNLAPVEGGDTPYLQQQNYSLAALAERDKQADLWAKPQALPAPSAPPVETSDETEKALWMVSMKTKGGRSVGPRKVH